MLLHKNNRFDDPIHRSTALNNVKRLVLATITLWLSIVEVPTAQASGDTTNRYLGILPVYVSPDEGRGVDEGVGVHALYGHRLSQRLFIEGLIAGTNLDTDSNGGTDFYQTSLGLDAVYRLTNSAALQPFVLLGIGAVYNDVFPDSGDETSLYADAGLGFVTSEMGNSGLQIRGEVRYFYDQFDDGFGDWRFGLGLQVPLGKTKVVTKYVEVPQRVEVPVVRTVPAQPADSDDDGVVDGVDRCPNTLASAQVDQYGCVKQRQVIKLEDVQFEVDSAELLPSSKVVLSDIARSLMGQPSLEVEVAGHTDSQGSASYNLNLSQSRAESVRNYLISKGVRSTRLRAKGYGESQPIAGNEVAAGRALNRRVEFRVMGTD